MKIKLKQLQETEINIPCPSFYKRFDNWFLGVFNENTITFISHSQDFNNVATGTAQVMDHYLRDVVIGDYKPCTEQEFFTAFNTAMGWLEDLNEINVCDSDDFKMEQAIYSVYPNLYNNNPTKEQI